ATNMAVPILRGEHGIWFGADNAYQLRIEPDELLIEVRDRSIDTGIHNRAHVLHYNTVHSPVDRLDPVALQPQDFVDEWLTRPWAEMESRSASSGPEKLERWHKLGSRFGEFSFVQSCSERPDHWQVGLDVDYLGDKELPEPLSLYFLVHQSGPYQFEMTDISFDRREGCPGDSPPNQD